MGLSPEVTPVTVRSCSRGVSAALLRGISPGTRVFQGRVQMLPTRDAVRCAGASASSFQPGAPPLAAVDGSPATDWQPVALPARLTVSVRGGLRTLRSAVLRWGRQWPSAPGPNIPPPPAPVITLRVELHAARVEERLDLAAGRHRLGPRVGNG